MSKIIYVVTSGSYSDYHIVSVFDRKLLAEEFCKFKNKYDRWAGDYIIKEFDINEGNFVPTKGYLVKNVVIPKKEYMDSEFSKTYIEEEFNEKFYKNSLNLGNVTFFWNVKQEKEYMKYVMEINRENKRVLKQLYTTSISGVIVYPLKENTMFDKVEKIFEDDIAKLKSYMINECDNKVEVFQELYGSVKQDE